MKLLLFLSLISVNTWAKSLVLVSYFDPFNAAPFNNSKTIALGLSDSFKNHAEISIKLCPLKTVYEKSFLELEACVKEQIEVPKLIIGLGEGDCSLKVETFARNKDKSTNPDNEGSHRDGVIKLGGARAIGMRYPLDTMYCAISKDERKDMEVSNWAGEFVCNNLSYLFSHNYPDQPFGFIHVPKNQCKELKELNPKSISTLTTMITAAVAVEEIEPLSTTKKEIESLRKYYKNDKCLSDFYRRTKGIDEKGFWPFSNFLKTQTN